MDWDTYFFELAHTVAKKSKDPSSKVGCVVIGPDKEIRSTGFNGFARGVRDDRARYNDREQKYNYVVHAELNAVCHAARIGHSLKGCTLYVTLPPCHSCANAIIQSGVAVVKYIVTPIFLATKDKWDEELKLSKILFKEAGVGCTSYQLKIDNATLTEQYVERCGTIPQTESEKDDASKAER